MKEGHLNDQYGFSSEELLLRIDASQLKTQLKFINSEASNKDKNGLYVNN